MTTQAISIAEIGQKVETEKSPNSARYYHAMLKRLRAYNGCDTIELSAVTSEYVAGFADYLLRQGVAPSTIGQMLKFFRATFKGLFGSEGASDFKDAFKGVSSANETATNLTDVNDIRTLVQSELPEMFFAKIRDVFMFCFYGGGLTLEMLKATDCTSPALPQQRLIVDNFEKTYGITFGDSVAALSETQYAKGLDAAAYAMRLRHPLTPVSAADGWAAAALTIGLPAERIASTVAVPTAYCKHIMAAESTSPQQRIAALRAVADSIADTRHHWYVMRCFDDTPADTAARIAQTADAPGFQTFIAPATKGGKARRSNLIEQLLFFRCHPADAPKIRETAGQAAYVYTSAGSRTPAIISDREMRTFMLLCDVAADTLEYHFPTDADGNPDIRIGDRARIAVGNLSGLSCIVRKTTKDKYKVMVELETLANMTITAEIPVEFLRFEA